MPKDLKNVLDNIESSEKAYRAVGSVLRNNPLPLIIPCHRVIIDLFEEMKSMDVLLDISNLFKTDFSQKVINSLIKIRPGESTTYSGLAKKINSKAYRAVGSVLRNNPLPLIIPCHRVIKKDGKIGGFMGKMDEDWQINLKRSLLRIEGIL
ncbi:unnamed protein product [marine sediment metagenome]|uniref:methylated-DNA--[protein]-cysteine S-methyltransferase n=1 Tax=marine sediment metagenome TaxID=412755 RepID=X1GHE4_9ZZZZ